MVFQGFNSKDAHEPGFKGDWESDVNLKLFRDEIEQIHPYIIYSHNSESNAYQTKKLASEKGWKNLAIVSSETHLPRLKRIFRKFFPNYQDLGFIAVPEPSERLKKKRTIKELFADFVTYFEFDGLPRGNGTETDKKIFEISDYRKSRYLDKPSNLTKKILGLP